MKHRDKPLPQAITEKTLTGNRTLLAPKTVTEYNTEPDQPISRPQNIFLQYRF